MLTIALLSAVGDFLEGSQVQVVYWSLALSGTAIFLIFMGLTIFGFGTLHDSDVGADGTIAEHADTGYSDFKLLSIRSVLAFITFFGWGGVLWGKHGWAGFFGALAFGCLMMFGTAILIYIVFKLQHSGNIKANDFIGQHGTVYFSIPAGRCESGKVTVTIGGYTSEVQAVADESIPTGATVVIAERLDERKFLVKKA